MAEIRVNVSSVGSKGNATATNNAAQYWAEKAREWAISETTVSGEDNSSKYYAGKAKEYAQSAQQYKNDTQEIADTAESNIDGLTSKFNSLYSEKSEALQSEYSTYSSSLEAAKTSALTSIKTTGTDAYTSVTTASTTALSDITNAKNTAVSSINGLSSDFLSLYTKKSEALSNEYSGYSNNLETAANSAVTNIQAVGTEAYTSITTSGTASLSDITAAKNIAVEDIQDEADTQISNIQSTGFYMRDGRLYYVDSEGQEQEFKSGGLEVCDIGMSLYIDETKGLRRWLNGQIVAINANTQGFLTRLKQIVALYPSLLTTEEDWQAAKKLSAFGQVGKFVFNYAEDEETVESVRLPAVVNVQGLLDLQNLGMTVEAGLPNITGAITGDEFPNALGVWFDGALYATNDSGKDTAVGSGYPSTVIRLDASRSSAVYGRSATVQEEAIQYPYYIQIATGQETEVNITNEIELNNPFFFGMSQYFDVEPNNLSWLKSDGEYKPKSVYPDYYNWILENVNKGVEGFKGQEGYCFIATDSSGYYWWVSTESPVVGASVYRYEAGVNSMFFDGIVETLTSNGFTFTSIFEGSSYTVTRDSSKDTSILHPAAWITDYDFVINTSDETFRLPIKSKFASSKFIRGNGMAIGLTDGSKNAGLDGNSSSLGTSTNQYGVNAGTLGSSHGDLLGAIGLTLDSSKSGIELDDTNLYLYYYVGETVQNANLIDAGRMAEFYATKQFATSAILPSDRYIDLTLGNSGATYTAPADGWYVVVKNNGLNNAYQYVDCHVMLPNYTPDGSVAPVSQYLYSVANNATAISNGIHCLIPIRKGQLMQISYDATGNTQQFRFIYAQGAQ